MKATRMHHSWVHMFITHQPTLTAQLHNFDLFRTCRTSSFCTVAWQLARFQLKRRIARSLSDSGASCTYLLQCNVSVFLSMQYLENVYPASVSWMWIQIHPSFCTLLAAVHQLARLWYDICGAVFYWTECLLRVCCVQNEHAVLFLGADVLATCSQPVKHHVRIHSRYAKLGLATKVTMNGV